MKIEIPDEMVGAVVMILQHYKKINQLEQTIDNQTLCENIQEMAMLQLINEVNAAEIGAMEHEYPQRTAALLAAHTIRLLVNYKEL